MVQFRQGGIPDTKKSCRKIGAGPAKHRKNEKEDEAEIHLPDLVAQDTLLFTEGAEQKDEGGIVPAALRGL